MFFLTEKRKVQIVKNKEAIAELQGQVNILQCANKGHKYEYLIDHSGYSRCYYKKCSLCGYEEEMEIEDFIKEKRIRARQDFINTLKEISYI